MSTRLPATADFDATTDPARGLTEAEAEARRARGEGNEARLASSRSYGEIIRSNLLNPFNLLLFLIGGLLILLGRPQDALASAGLLLLNVCISMIQEVRAKRQLDEIALLARPRARVLREGEAREVDPSDVVRGDVLLLDAGDQVIADGPVLAGTGEIDESLLTGESDAVAKGAGDALYSGSFCVTGPLRYEAARVGAESFANQLTAEARAFRVTYTPLQRDVMLVIRIFLLLAAFLGFMLWVNGRLNETILVRDVQMAAVIAGVVSIGLFFMTIVAYALGALRMADQGALIQQPNAVESLSHVDVLCTDKTGTLTANRIELRDVQPVAGVSRDALEDLLGTMAASASARNATSGALAAALPRAARALADEVPFSSARKWSAVAFDDAQGRGCCVLGAPAMLAPRLTHDGDLGAQAAAWAGEGMRVLLVAGNQGQARLHDEAGEPALPPLEPFGLVCFGDELRPKVAETVAGFRAAGVTLKVISGDAPETVAALARQAGIGGGGELRTISGLDLDALGDAALAELAESSTVFGRITPEQKERLVDALRARGRYVAMIGDGVNDVLSLKKADVGVAMQSGSGAARGVADIVLLGDSFGALVPALGEGQRIANGMRDVFRIMLPRTLTLAMLLIAVAMMGLASPFLPTNAGLWAFLCAGLPPMALVAWARTGRRGARPLRDALRVTAPAALLNTIFGVLVYGGVYAAVLTEIVQVEVSAEQVARLEAFVGFSFQTPDQALNETAAIVARSALTPMLILFGLALLLFVLPPARFFALEDRLEDELEDEPVPAWRPLGLVGAMLALLALSLALPRLRELVGLALLPAWAYALLLGLTLLWALLFRWMVRRRWVERYFGLAGDAEGA